MARAKPLTDTQLVLLSAASQRDDGLLVQPGHLRGGVAHTVATRLQEEGLAARIAVGVQAPSWFEDETGAKIGLVITPAGLAVLGLGEADKNETPSAPPQPPPSKAQNATKQNLLLSLLSRDEGATLADIMQATGWLAHTGRAALTRLRQSGHPVIRERTEAGQSVYRLPSAIHDASAAVGGEA